MDISVICIIIFYKDFFFILNIFCCFNIFTKGKHYEKEISLKKGNQASSLEELTGIGFAIASELLDADANVIILDVEKKIKRSRQNLGNIKFYYAFDVTDTAHYDELISKIGKKPHLSTFC